MTASDPVRIDLHRRVVPIRLFEEAAGPLAVLDGVPAARFCQLRVAYLAAPESLE